MVHKTDFMMGGCSLSRFNVEQKCYQIAGVKIGGQPGERATVLCGSIFFRGHKIVRDNLRGDFDREAARALLVEEAEISAETGNPRIIDVIGDTAEALARHAEFVLRETESPILFDSLTPEARSGALEILKPDALLGERIIYNSLDPITSRQGDCEFCRLVKEDPVGRERCYGSYARAGKQAKKWNEPYFIRCHAGLITWACPILMNDNHVGNMICGHVLMWEPEELFWLEMKESIKDLGQDSEVLLNAAHKLDVVSATQAQAAADLLFIIANYLAKAGTELFDYQRKLREVGSWLWVENSRRGDAGKGEGAGSAARFFNLESRIFVEIRQSNIENARKLLESLALELFTRSKGQIEVIKGSCIEFIGSLARLATECGIKFEESFRFE